MLCSFVRLPFSKFSLIFYYVAVASIRHNAVVIIFIFIYAMPIDAVAHLFTITVRNDNKYRHA